MAEKNYKTVAVVPEMPRTIDNQQLHIYTPVGSTGNFGVFKPDGDQFVIVDGVLRADASKLIQLADTPAIVVENGGRTKVYIAFTNPNNTLNRKFQFIFENIKGKQGPKGDDGVSITSVTQTGIDGGTRVTITLSNGQSTSFDVYNGINTNFQVVNVLPTENISTSTIYLVPSQNPASENVYDEYIYINGDWEHIGSTTIDLSGKLDKVTEVTPNIQFYAKAPDGSQVMKEIKGGNGITVDAASDNKSLEVKVGDTIKLEQNQTLKIVNPFNTKYVEIGHNKIDFSPVATRFSVNSFDYDAYAKNNYGPNIKTEEGVIASPGLSLHWLGLNMYYEISDVPTSTTSGTLPDNISWTYLKSHPEQLRILFNNEFYQLADNQHTTGTLVFSHVGHEGGQLIIKTITITIDTRGWVLTTIKPAEEAYHVELTDSNSGSTLSVEQYNALKADVNSYILLENGPTFRLARVLTTDDGIMNYQNVTGNITRSVSITAAGVWTFYSETVELTSNKTTSLSASSTNTQYPSAAATYTYGQTVLTTAKSYTDTAIANAITTALNTPV